MGDFNKIAVKGDEKGSYIILELRKITYIEAEGHFIMIHSADKCFRAKGPLKNIEMQLGGKGFLRVHRAFLVSVYHIKEIYDGCVILDDRSGTLVPVGMKYQASMREEIEKSGCRFL